MMEEKILEVLNELDDDMIESVERLRSRKRKIILWMKSVSFAACLCIVTVSLFVLGRSGVLHFGGSDEKANTSSDESAMLGNRPSPEAIPDGGTDTVPELDDENSMTDEANNDLEHAITREFPSVYVEILEWQEDGFCAQVHEIIDTSVLTVGTKVNVWFGDNICVGYWEEDKSTYYEVKETPDQETFPEGSLVGVRFKRIHKDEAPISIVAEAIWSKGEDKK